MVRGFHQGHAVRKNFVAWFVGTGLVGLIVVGLGMRAMATPQNYLLFNQLYAPKAGTPLAQAYCLICHSAMPPSEKALNPYGRDLLKAAAGKPIDEKAFRAIENLFSAGDDVSNIDKIKAGLLPGSSKPK